MRNELTTNSMIPETTFGIFYFQADGPQPAAILYDCYLYYYNKIY